MDGIGESSQKKPGLTSDARAEEGARLRISQGSEGTFKSSLRGDGDVGFKEPGVAVGEEASDPSDFSEEALDRKIKQADLMSPYWSDEYEQISTPYQTMPITQAAELLQRAHNDMSYWIQETTRLEEISESTEGLDEKFSPAIESYDRVIKNIGAVIRLLEKNSGASDFNSDLLQGAMSDLSLTDKEGSVSSASLKSSALMTPPTVAALLTPPVQASSFTSMSAKMGGLLSYQPPGLLDGMSQGWIKQQADLLVKQAEMLRAKADETYRWAQDAFIRADYDRSLAHYKNAVSLAEQTAEAYVQTERAHLQLAQFSLGKKIRQHGKNLKNTYAQKAAQWQYEISQLPQKIEQIQREAKMQSSFQKSADARAKKNQALEQGTAADAIERNEIGGTLRVLAKHLEVTSMHFENAGKAYAARNEQQAREFEGKALAVQQSISSLEGHLDYLIKAKEEWNSEDASTRCLENDEALGRSVLKDRFIGPLVRKERVTDPITSEIHYLEMAAEYLMVTLKEGETDAGFLEKLNVVDARLEVISPSSALYRLHYNPNRTLPHPWLDTMDAIKKKITDESLVLRCHPDYFMELHSDIDASSTLPPEEVKEPWSLHGQHGVHPPVDFFTGNVLGIHPKLPIRVAVIDTGIREDHKAFVNNIKRGTHNGVMTYGYDALASNDVMKGYPEDASGHGSHVAGIIAAAVHDVTEIVVKKEKLNENDPDVFEKKPIEKASITGLAGIPGMVELIVCKWVAPGQIKGLCSNAIKCIEYAADQKAEIMNCSWSRRLFAPKYEIGFKPEEVQDLENAIKGKPFAVVATAGNTPVDNDQRNIYPANFVLPNLVTVAATNKTGSLANGFSAFGEKSVHIAAPGLEILSTWHTADDAYARLTGTSQAAPLVTATLAFIKAKFSHLNAAGLIKHLRQAVDNTNRAKLKVQWGSLNLTKALEVPIAAAAEEKAEVHEGSKKIKAGGSKKGKPSKIVATNT